ncbi:pyridoxal 5'-phosphate synthase pdxT subunit [Marchantia polymorpha subsp. ruderalis]|uniref:glutaminase n=3 Tax=Marchantia polymorpha TaxID=3197 RepID=A0A176W7M0_MARPO|nr:hypothetical protein AXG93_1617s1070 [Marchantia polymorpha subsp. ruderalis]PTQ34359.1 hypothetical protein MARPO_0081s0077 [Marchantia polymorpha]BBN18820.1 hypothetical protein Mp_8g05750 [Marchantia polymorpha subsp. ruderalis]|eukprot:PTQ34359.1 hypothetical protein MARPO_0081s0077 [Marchantia polymorpha]
MAVGVLALQGSFKEHIVALRKLGVDAVEVRKPEQLSGLSGLIIPGGESTTMAKLAEQYKLIPALKDFGISGKPIWGTCAGLIFLADKAVGQKIGGQALLGGLDCTVHRNYFGSQLNSFETELPAPPALAEIGGSENFRAVFIRAPAIVDAGPNVEVLAALDVPSGESGASSPGNEAEEKGQKVIVAVRQGNLLATAFHPELTGDTRWHSLFLKMVPKGGKADVPVKAVEESASLIRPFTDPKDLPVFRDASFLVFE